MKKVVTLNQSQIVEIVQKVIDEAELMVEPFVMTPYNGKVKITNTQTKQSLVYKLEKETLFGRIQVNVDDFPMGKYIKVSVVGKSKVVPIDKELVKNMITSNWGKKQLVLGKGEDKIFFVKN